LFWLSSVVLGVTRLASGSRLGRSPTAERPEGLEADAKGVTRYGRRRLLGRGVRGASCLLFGLKGVRASGLVARFLAAPGWGCWSSLRRARGGMMGFAVPLGGGVNQWERPRLWGS
jgi:hypothetical protein